MRTTTATFQEEMVILGSFFSLCVVGTIEEVLHRDRVSQKLIMKCRSETNLLSSSSFTQRIGPKECDILAICSRLDCINILYRSTFYERIAKNFTCVIMGQLCKRSGGGGKTGACCFGLARVGALVGH